MLITLVFTIDNDYYSSMSETEVVINEVCKSIWFCAGRCKLNRARDVFFDYHFSTAMELMPGAQRWFF